MKKTTAKYLVDHRKEIEDKLKLLSDKAIVGAVRADNTDEAKMIARFSEFFSGMLNIIDREINPLKEKENVNKQSRSLV